MSGHTPRNYPFDAQPEITKDQFIQELKQLEKWNPMDTYTTDPHTGYPMYLTHGRYITFNTDKGSIRVSTLDGDVYYGTFWGKKKGLRYVEMINWLGKSAPYKGR